MLNVNTISSNILLKIYDYSKILKAGTYIFVEFSLENIIIYGVQDYMFSTISRIIIPNTTDILGSIGLEIGIKDEPKFGDFVKSLVPCVDIKVESDKLINEKQSQICVLSSKLYTTFISKRNNLNSYISTDGLNPYEVETECIEELREILNKLRAANSQIFFNLNKNDRTLIPLYAGMLPLNKTDKLSISVLSADTWFLCKYVVIKKKVSAPINIFVLYRKL